MMLKSSSYKQSNHIVSHSFDIQQSQTQSFNNASHNSFQQNKNISQPELESQELFFQASLQFIRKKKIDNYFLFNDDLIGQGSFAKVYKGMNTLTIAIKVMQIRDIMENKLYGLVEAEMQIIKSLKHPNVLRCYDILITDNNCYIVTQYCEDGELKQYIKKQLKNNKSHEQDNSMLNLITLQPLIYDIYQGLLYLERKSIIHRDIKMSNILIKNGKAKIADFGLAAFSKKEGQIFIDVKVGSPIYMSPQAFLDSIYGPKTDVWAFGILLFEFFHGITPFQRCRNTKQLEIEISKPFEESKIIANISENAKRLICMCLSHQLQDRPSFKDLWGEEYIKCLRLKSYVSSKGLSNYKQTAMQTLRKQVQKNKSQKKLQKTFQTSQSLSILKISGDLQIDSSKVQFQKFEDKQQEKQLKEEGYSFEDFLKMNSQEQQKSQITVENSKSEQKINCHQINLDPQVSNLPLFQNSKQNHSKSFEDEMEEFYRQAQRMMVQQNFIKQSSSQSSQKVPNDQSVRQLKMLDDKNKVQQKKEQMIGNEMTQIKTQTLKQKYSSTKEIISIKNEIQDNFCMDKQETFNSDDKSFDKSIKSLSKARKINLNKNYCQFQQKQQNITLQYEALTQINEQNVQNPKIEEQKICNQEISQTFSNSQKCNDLQTQNFIQNESVSNQCNKNITQISSTILDNQKQKQKEQTKNISPVKVNLNDSVHRQNLKKFTNILKRKQSHQPYDIIKPKQNLYKKPSKNKKQSQDIDLILVLLEFVRFIVKYIKFLKIIKDSALTQKISLQFTNQNQTKYNGENSIKIWEKYQQLFNAQRKSDVICQKLHSFCKQILMKKVSQIIFTLNSQKSSELFQIVKTHKSLLNGLKISDNPLKYNIYNYMTFFEQIFQDVKQIQDILTIFVDQNLERSQSQSLDLMIESLCWQGLWLSKTYDTFLQLQKYLNPGGKAEYQFNSKSQDLKSIMKQLQQFVENYQKVQLHLTSQDLQQSQKQFSNENQTQRIKNNINFFFQLVYEVQLRKMNSINL